MKTALVFGGAFNPPTIAHIELANETRKKLGFDYVIFVPSKMSYIENEQKKNFAYTDEERYAMLHAISKKRDWMIVSDYEIHQSKQPRTYTTLLHFKQEGYTCKLLFGSDKLEELETGWRYVNEIAHEFGIVCMSRNHDDTSSIINNNAYLKQLEDCITLVETPGNYHTISSSKVRSAIQNHKEETIKEFVPKEIYDLLK